MTYYTIYQTTNQINGKIYIGSHKTKDLNDNYMGSGKYLKHAIDKHGVENFTKEILFVFGTAEEMYAKEAELVTAEFIAESNTYNLKVGGFGGFDYLNNAFDNPTHTRSHLAKMVELRKKKYPNGTMYGKCHSEKTKQLFRAFRKNNSPKGFLGKKHSEISKNKISQSNKITSAGARNSQFGTMWITDGNQNKKIKTGDALPNGWYQGRKQIWRVNQVGPGTSC